MPELLKMCLVVCPLVFLAGITLGVLALVPFASAAALRVNLR